MLEGPFENEEEFGSSEAATKEQRTWALITHLACIAGLIIPLGNVILPLVVWLVKKDEWPYVAAHSKEALNFQITVTIGVIASIALSCVVVGLITLPLVLLASLVLGILAAVRANDGRAFRYPATLRLVK